MAVDPMGLTPMSPVIADVGTVEIPDLERITKLPAVPRLTGARAANASWFKNIATTPRATHDPQALSSVFTWTDLSFINVLLDHTAATQASVLTHEG